MSVWPGNLRISLPVAASQSRMVLSPPALATLLPSGLKATARTASACPVKQSSSRPVCVSQTFTVPSWLHWPACCRRGCRPGPSPSELWRILPSPKIRPTCAGNPCGGAGQLPAGAGERLAASPSRPAARAASPFLANVSPRTSQSGENFPAGRPCPRRRVPGVLRLKLLDLLGGECRRSVGGRREEGAEKEGGEGSRDRPAAEASDSLRASRT